MKKKVTVKNQMLPALDIEVESNERSVLPAHTNTITKENNFAKQTHLKPFYTKDLALEYLKKHPNLCLFGEDTNAQLVKQFYITNRKTIYLYSLQKKFHLYEYLESNDTAITKCCTFCYSFYWSLTNKIFVILTKTRPKTL